MTKLEHALITKREISDVAHFYRRFDFYVYKQVHEILNISDIVTEKQTILKRTLFIASFKDLYTN